MAFRSSSFPRDGATALLYPTLSDPVFRAIYARELEKEISAVEEESGRGAPEDQESSVSRITNHFPCLRNLSLID